MKENKYDQETFFRKYSMMQRSRQGLDGAGEWHTLQSMLPDFLGKQVLDLGCGFGWHCDYAVKHGATAVVGIDLSEKMLSRAKSLNDSPKITYLRSSIEDYNYPSDTFDVVLSSLAFHYVRDFTALCKKINETLKPCGDFVFSVEHPVFTAYGNQDWICDADGNKLHWPIDHYFEESKRQANFLGESVTKYHRTLTTYLSSILDNGFEIVAVREPLPNKKQLAEIPEMREELRRPMMLLVSARKTK